MPRLSSPKSINLRFGQPIIECSPFVQTVILSQRGSFCDFCLKKIETTPIGCRNCSNVFYCSSDCRQQDYKGQHQIECRLRLSDKITNRISEAVRINSESTSQVNQFNLFDHLDLNDMIDLTVLFFRLLKKFKSSSKDQESHTLQYYIGDKLHQTTWKDLSQSVNIRSNPKRLRQSEPISMYLSRYNSLTDDEIIEVDRLIGVDFPNDEYFRNLYIENNVKYVLKNLIERVQDQILADRLNWNRNKKTDIDVDDGKTLKMKGEKKENQQQDLFNEFVDDLQQKKFWQHLDNSKPSEYNQMTDYFLNKMFKLLEKPDSKTDKTLVDGEKSLERQHLSEETEGVFYYDSHPEEVNYNIDLLNCDPSLIDCDEEEGIKVLRSNYRFIYLKSLQRRSTTHDNELDYYYGFWLDEILKILADPNIKEHFETLDYSDIEKIFSLTIRYSIAVCGAFSILPIAKAVFLPLTQLEHSCLPNTSVIFDGNRLKMYYLPDKKLPSADLKNKKRLNLFDLRVDFNHEIASKETSIDIYKLNKLRLINCKCDRCRLAKTEIRSEINQLFDQFIDDANDPRDDELEDIFAFKSPDFEFLNESDYNLDHFRTLSQMAPTSDKMAIFDYENCLSSLTNANIRYGNRLDLEYSKKIYDLLFDTLDSLRRIFGYYHKHITIILLQINYCNLTIIKACDDQVEMFCRIKFFHRYLLELIDAIQITHGSDNTNLPKLQIIHEKCHGLLQKIFQTHGNEINNLLKKLGKRQHSFEELNLTECGSFENFIQADLEKIKQLGGSAAKSDEDDGGYCYNPYLSEDKFDFEPMDTDYGFGHHEELKDLDVMLDNLNEITDFFQYRFL